jgi:hypothetical protein
MRRTVFTGMAKPTPEETPVWEKIIVFTPITRPWLSSSGPPEFPGLIGASVWIMFGMLNTRDPGRMTRPMALTIPTVIVPSSPKGLPMAMASCPGRTAPESPRVTG